MTERAKIITAVAERADFGPAYAGEDFVTLTFRVPKGTPALAGIWELTPVRAGWPDWAKSKTNYVADGECAPVKES